MNIAHVKGKKPDDIRTLDIQFDEFERVDDLMRVINSCCATDPAERPYPTMLVDNIQGFLERPSIETPTALYVRGSGSFAKKGSKRKPQTLDREDVVNEP